MMADVLFGLKIGVGAAAGVLIVAGVLVALDNAFAWMIRRYRWHGLPFRWRVQ